MFYNEKNVFSVSVTAKKRKYPDVYYFPNNDKWSDESYFKVIDRYLSNGDCKEFLVECLHDIPELKKCSEMGFYEFIKFYESNYDRITKLTALADKSELVALTSSVTNSLDELINILEKGEYHFYKNIYFRDFAPLVYNKKIELDNELGYIYKKDMLLDYGCIETKQGIIKFFDKNFAKEVYEKHLTGGAQNESEFTTSEQK